MPIKADSDNFWHVLFSSSINGVSRIAKGVGGKLLSASHSPYRYEQRACLMEHNKQHPGLVLKLV